MRHQGRIPLHFRVGITGHRDIDTDDPVLKEAICWALDLVESRCRKGTAATPVNLTVVSALAEGADRIVAQIAIQRGACLEVVLPLPPDDYMTDFESDTSKSEFRTLLDTARPAVTEVGTANKRDQAYEQAGRAIVDRSDVLLALWDGWAAQGRGGTAEIVSYARRQHVPILQVAVARLGSGSPHPRTVDEPELPEVFGLLSNQAFSRLDKFNSLRNRGTRSALLPPKLKTPVPSHVQSFVNYAQPYFDRAEEVARSSQLVFTWLTRLLYSLAAAAVIVVATQVIFFGHDHGIVWAEVVALVAVVVTLILGKRARWHDRWLGARYLAERIRSGVFLAAIGGGSDLRTAAGGVPPADCEQSDPNRTRAERVAAAIRGWAYDRQLAARHRAARIGARLFPAGDDDDRQSPADVVQQAASDRPDPNREWVERAFREVYWRARRFPPAESELDVLKSLLEEAWIDNQVIYHKGVSRRLTNRQRQLSWLAVLLFGVSALVALFHSMNVLEPDAPLDIWGYCSVVIPAVGAAISGYSAQREYARLAERSDLMVTRLQGVRKHIKGSKRLSSLRRAASRTELLMRTETAEWYEVVRLHDLEVPA